MKRFNAMISYLSEDQGVIDSYLAFDDFSEFVKGLTRGPKPETIQNVLISRYGIYPMTIEEDAALRQLPKKGR